MADEVGEYFTVGEDELLEVVGNEAVFIEVVNPSVAESSSRFPPIDAADGVRDFEMGGDQGAQDNDLGRGEEKGAEDDDLGRGDGAENDDLGPGDEKGAEDDDLGRGDGEGGDNDLEPGEETGDKSKKRRRAAELLKSTNQRLVRSLSSLSEKAKKLSADRGVTIYFKGRYSSITQEGRKANVSTFQVGSNFELETGNPIVGANKEPLASINTVRAAIEDLISLQPRHESPPAPSTSQNTPTSSQNLFLSPFRPQSRTSESDCEKGVCQFHILDQQSAAWIGCDFKSSNKKCPYRVHSACLGFPEATHSIVTSFPRYFCSEHIQIVGPTLIPNNEPAVPPPSKRGRGSRGRRGARRNLGTALETQTN